MIVPNPKPNKPRSPNPNPALPSVRPGAGNVGRLNTPAIHFGQVPAARVPAENAREDHWVAPRNVRVCGNVGSAAVSHPRSGRRNARRRFSAACRGDVGVLCLQGQIGFVVLLFGVGVVCRVSAKSTGHVSNPFMNQSIRDALTPPAPSAGCDAYTPLSGQAHSSWPWCFPLGPAC